MRIRSITTFMDLKWPINQLSLQKAGIFSRNAKAVFESSGYPVQTIRLATPPFSQCLNQPIDTAILTQIEVLGHSEGFEYVSLGPAEPTQLASYAAIPDMLAHSSNLFFGGHLTTKNHEISLPAVRACASVIHQAADLEANGFANLRFAALANVPPWAPFFPAAYHEGKKPAFALALEAADLVVSAFEAANSLKDARGRLIESIESHASILTQQAQKLSQTYDLAFKGIDFTPAPYPHADISLGNALEKLGLSAVGNAGSLAAAAFLTDTIDRAQYQRIGFNGLMMPLLEDSTLARRGKEGILSLTDLLLYSAVCGTGLDTLPLPGDASADQIEAVLMDLAALALRLDKPLTARLMPIPGKKAGDPTGFDFEFFANSHVLSLPAAPLWGLMKGDETIQISPKPSPQR
jgi:hypothetical protein